MKLLILGGTTEGKALAQSLSQSAVVGLEIIYSVAGLVRQPELLCEVISGGFSPRGGLQQYLQQNAVDAVFDCTHPYAVQMSTTAVAAARANNIPCWRIERPKWEPQQGDDWRCYSSWSALLESTKDFNSVLLTCGQLTQQQMHLLTTQRPVQRQVLRTAIAPSVELPESMQWLKAIGPFSLDNERALMQQYQIDCLVSKNSGGEATAAKLVAARQLGIPVMLLERPPLPECDRSFIRIDDAVSFLAERIGSKHHV